MDKLITQIYLINLALLITHEIDSAFWHEWELFNLPGGIQLFLLINLALILLFLIGAESVIRRGKSWKTFSNALAISGILAFFIHMYFILKGNTEFLLPVSILILISIFITSIIELIVTNLRFNKNK
jgi:Kef-type K+ transport system membrane component KefB